MEVVPVSSVSYWLKANENVRSHGRRVNQTVLILYRIRAPVDGVLASAVSWKKVVLGAPGNSLCR